MAFSAKDVAALRERTGCGMMDCKKALTQADGDMEKAVEFLREKGLAAAEKKAGRIAAEGVVYAYEANGVGVVIEVNAETDFVAKNASFMEFVETCAKTVAEQNPADVPALMSLKAVGSEFTVDQLLKDKILTIGENMNVRRFARYEGDLVTYVHGGGRIGVMVGFDTDVGGKDGFREFAKDIAMQIAASTPLYLNRDAIPEERLAKEKEILTAQAMNEGKPENIAQKMVQGRIRKFFEEVCLVDQAFIKDGDLSVQKYIEKTAAALGGKIAVTQFVRFEKGEGMEKREDNFAEEIASLVK